jgi:creatinine amidohydrolase
MAGSSGSEVRYERLRPHQIREAREACPVAYLPIGTIEWHGLHNPVGLDTLKIHGLCIRCAEAGGGLVFPPLYYGEHREHALMEAMASDREDIAREMGLDLANFRLGYMFQSVSEQYTNYHHLLLHVFHEIKSLGFKVIAVGCGHYPLLDHARAAGAIFHQAQRHGAEKTITWCWSGYELVRGDERFPACGDHAGRWETSLLMALDPGMQDLSRVADAPDTKPIGASNNGVEQSSEEYGRTAAEAIVERVTARVAELLSDADKYRGHGAPM